MPKLPKSPPPRDPGETRREFLLHSLATATSLGLGSVLIPACNGVSRGEKREPPGPLTVLTPDEAAVFDAWCEQLAPGAAAAGVSRYLDSQLAAPRPEALLFLRILANPPFVDFYRRGIAGIEQEVQELFGNGSSYVTLNDTQQRQLIDAAAADKTVVWKNPPPSFFFFVSRGDAVDVAFGTEAGFKRLNLPYLAHIRPPTSW